MHEHAQVRRPSGMDEQTIDSALRAANAALTGRAEQQTARFASIELRSVDPQTGAWELAAMASVALATVLLVIGLWFL